MAETICELFKTKGGGGLHATIVQSITASYVSNGLVAQERTWVAIGKVKEAPSRLSNITSERRTKANKVC